MPEKLKNKRSKTQIVALTGHTRGLGQSLREAFLLKGHKVLGFSKTNGFDIASSSVRKSIIKKSSTADIFINNAYHPKSQFDLLAELFKEWKDKNKIIINIGSRGTNRTRPYLDLYGANKSALDNLCLNLSQIKNRKCKVINFKPGQIDTDFDTEWNLKKEALSKPMSVKLVAEFICYIMSFSRKNLEVNEITFGNMRE